MRNPFDKQIADTIRKELGSIKASDDLIARTLARINDEEEGRDNTAPVTHLSALNMGYIRQQEQNREKRDRKISRIVVGTLAVAAMCCVTFNLLTFFRNDPDKVTSSTTQAELSVSAVVTGSADSSVTAGGASHTDYSEYIYRSDITMASVVYLPSNAGSSNSTKPDEFRNYRSFSDYRTF